MRVWSTVIGVGDAALACFGAAARQYSGAEENRVAPAVAADALASGLDVLTFNVNVQRLTFNSDSPG